MEPSKCRGGILRAEVNSVVKLHNNSDGVPFFSFFF